MLKLTTKLFKRRLRHNFQLSIITLMSFFGVLSITPYALYRYYTADLTVAIADSFAIISILVAVIYAWRTNNTVKPGLYLAIIFSTVATIVTIKLGINGYFWIYPLILFNFFMVPPLRALTIMVAVLASVVIYHTLHPNTVFPNHYQMVSFLVTCLLSSFLTFIFAFRTQHQRERLENLASHDPLTGAYNRRIMAIELNKAVRDTRSMRIYSLLIMDLDHFKNINDTFGHLTGDQVLVDFVRIIQASIRENDQLFRYGGEEFALLLPDTNHDGLEVVAAMLKKQVSSKLYSPAGSVSVSIGGAVLNSKESYPDWFKRADDQLDKAKQAGRNCCRIAAPDYLSYQAA